MNILVAGGAGFIGSHLIDALLSEEHSIICADNMVLGNTDNIAHLKENKNFVFIKCDLSKQENTDFIFEKYNIDMVYHLAANSDIQKGALQPEIDFYDTFMTTRCILESMRKFNVKKLFFASTSAVYGEMCDVNLKETTGGIKPVSYYGGAKLASEAMIYSYCSMNDLKVVIFRFPNVIGPRLTHGVIYDFVKKLRSNPKKLQILGDGTQCKPYLHVFDLVNGIMMFTREIKQGAEVYNIGVKSATTVTRIAEIVRDKMGLKNTSFEYTGGDRGWKGDVPKFEYDISKIIDAGWRPTMSSDEAVETTVEEVLK